MTTRRRFTTNTKGSIFLSSRKAMIRSTVLWCLLCQFIATWLPLLQQPVDAYTPYFYHHRHHQQQQQQQQQQTHHHFYRSPRSHQNYRSTILNRNHAAISRTSSNRIMMMNANIEEDYDDDEYNFNFNRLERITQSTDTIRPETNFGSENVPEGQRPINEYLDVTNQPFFTWARECDTSGLLLRFTILYTVLFVGVCYPISGATFTQDGYQLHKIVSSNVGAMFVTLLLLFRIYSGYDYIGQRLQSKYIEYEETGWYDGDIQEKTKTELLRDRMLYTNQVKPVVDRLKLFVVIGTSFFVGSVIALNVVLSKYPVFDQYDPDVLSRLSYDDKLADSAAINTGGKPAYCDSRYYRAIANGGLGCK
jgi:hypothetical protein